MNRDSASVTRVKYVVSSVVAPVPILCAVTILYGSLAAADLAEGYAAYARGDYELAHEEMLQVAQAGDYNASYYVGLLYWEGKGVESSPDTAVRWLTDAAARGHTGAQLLMALAYENGQGVAQDYHRGAEYMSAAAHGGNPDAQYYLSIYYRDGRGVVQDQFQSLVWAERAVGGDRSNALFLDSLILLGATREWGRGLPQDLVEAYKWYALAAGFSTNETHIFDSAGRAMDALSIRMTGAQIAEALRRADEWTSG
jgi:TPR repeat protein